MVASTIRDRRFTRSGCNATPLELIEHQLTATDDQLADARAGLIAACRRVAALQGAVETWTEFREVIRTRSRARTTRVS